MKSAYTYPVSVPDVLARPRFPIHDVVASWWSSRSRGLPAAGIELRLPTGDVDLVFDVASGEAILAGPSTLPRPFDARPERDLAGVTIVPGRATALLGVGLHELRDQHVPLADLWGDAVVDEILHRLGEAPRPQARLPVLAGFLARRLARGDHSSGPMAAAIADGIRRDPVGIRIDDLARRTGRSRRRLEQLARQDLGMTMKAYQRLHRFRHALVRIDEAQHIGWADFAGATGYYDQAHFINEFRNHAGMAPTTYLESRGPDLNHVVSPASKTRRSPSVTVAPEVTQ